jgi:regulator of nucleoside diphosphate kinase
MDAETTIILTQEDYEKLTNLLRSTHFKASEHLEEEISRAQVVPQADVPHDVVTMNSRVIFLDEETGKESEVILVYPQDANVTAKKISILAPVGIALIGLRVNQSIDWPLPNGSTRKIKIVSVLSQSEVG